MLPTIKPSDLESNCAQVLCLRMPSHNEIVFENYPLPSNAKYIIEEFEKSEGFQTGQVKLFGDGKTKRYILALFCQKYAGPPVETDDSTRRAMWLACSIRNLSTVTGIKDILFVDTHIQNELSELYCSLLRIWSREHSRIRVTITEEDSLVMEHVSEVKKAKLFDEAYFDPTINFHLRNFIRKKIVKCSCQEKFIPEKSELVCFKCRKAPIDISTLSWSNSNFETLVFNIPSEWGWSKFFSDNLSIVKEVSNDLSEQSAQLIMPELFKVLEAFRLTKPEDIRVIIIGQDPYPTPGVATGLAFSSNGNIPKSLQNIYKELESDGFKSSKDGRLEKWSKQGVFLINTALTLAGECNGHKKIWQKFTEALFKYLNKMPIPLVVIMWGSNAQAYSSLFSTRHRKITSAHPSPQSADKGFFGSCPFSKANAFLEELKQKPIDWNLS